MAELLKVLPEPPPRQPDPADLASRDDQLLKSALKVDFAAVRAPVLFIHTGERVPERAEDDRGFAQMTPVQQEKPRAMIPEAVQRVAEIRSMPGWKIVQLEHADHYTRCEPSGALPTLSVHGSGGNG